MTPFTLSGAMAPVTVAGALVQQNAEALAGIAFTQMVRKGAPVGYGGFTSNVDMKSGAPAFGTPEYMKAQLVGGQLARRYSLPYRTSNTCAANTVDAQAAYESVFSLWGAIEGGGNFIMHGAGWLEGGLRCSYEKPSSTSISCRWWPSSSPRSTCPTMRSASRPSARSAPAAISSAPPHTLARYETAFYSPIISDWRNYQQWLAAGKPEALQKANASLRQALAALRAAADRPGDRRGARTPSSASRKEEGGAPTDFESVKPAAPFS